MAVVTTRGFYALAAMTELLYHPQGKAVKIKTIAKNAKIPGKYLEQILLDLKKADLLSSVKGAHGGYMLSREPDQVTIYEILKAVEGAFLKLEYSAEDTAMQLYWDETFTSLRGLFERPLSDMRRYRAKAAEQFVFRI